MSHYCGFLPLVNLWVRSFSDRQMTTRPLFLVIEHHGIYGSSFASFYQHCIILRLSLGPHGLEPALNFKICIYGLFSWHGTKLPILTFSKLLKGKHPAFNRHGSLIGFVDIPEADTGSIQ